MVSNKPTQPLSIVANPGTTNKSSEAFRLAKLLNLIGSSFLPCFVFCRLKEYVENPLCHVYVCGNVNVALGVARAFQDLIGEDALAELVHEGRLHEDVFGVGSHDRK